MRKGTKVAVWALGLLVVTCLVANVLLTLAYRDKDEQVERALGGNVALIRHSYLNGVQRWMAERPEDVTGQIIASQMLIDAGRSVEDVVSEIDAEHARGWEDIGVAVLLAGGDLRGVALALDEEAEMSQQCADRFREVQRIVDAVQSALPEVDNDRQVTFDEAAWTAVVEKANAYSDGAFARQQARNDGGGLCAPASAGG